MYDDYEHDSRAERNQYFRDLEWEVEEAKEQRQSQIRRRNYNLTKDIESYFNDKVY